MPLDNKESILEQFNSKMTLESLRSSGLFTYHGSNSDIIGPLSEELSAQAQRKLSEYISLPLMVKSCNGEMPTDIDILISYIGASAILCITRLTTMS